MASFRKRGTKWEYRIVYQDRQTGKQKEKAKGGFRTKKEAQLASLEEEKLINHYGFAESGNETIGDFLEKWSEIYKKLNVKPITYSVQERNIRLNILPRWEKYRLRDITRTDYQKWINDLRGHYSEGTVRRIHSIFSCAISDAVHEFRILRENPIQRIKIPKEVNKNKTIQFFTREQLDIFLDGTKPVKNTKYKTSTQYYVLFSLMARTGMRIGETLALTWDDINLDTKTLTINKTLVYPLNFRALPFYA